MWNLKNSHHFEATFSEAEMQVDANSQCHHGDIAVYIVS